MKVETDSKKIAKVWYEILMEAEERKKKQQSQQPANIQSAHNKNFSESQTKELDSNGIVLKEEE